MEDSNTRQLIKLYRRTGSPKALDILIRNHEGAIKFAAGKSPDNIISYADKISIGNITLLKLVRTGGFDLRFKVKFNTHLIQQTKFRIIDEIRSQQKHHRKRVKDWEFARTIDNKLVFLYEETELHEKLVKEIQSLPKTEQIVMACIHSGMTMTQIATQAGVSVTRISQIVNKSRQIIKKKLSDD